MNAAMTTTPQSGSDHLAHPTSSPWGIALAACAIVVTADLLGVPWLREPVAGLPAGLWVIAMATAALAAPVRSRLAAGLERLLTLLGAGGPVRQLDPASTDTPAAPGWWPANPFLSVCLDALTRAAAALIGLAFLPLWGGGPSPDLRRRVETFLTRTPLPTRPLRIALCLPDDEADAIVAAPSTGASRIQFFRMAEWDEPLSACRRHCFDAAVFHDGEGPLRIVTLERPGHPARVVEWADLNGELTFGKLFPGRIDPAAVVLEGATASRVRAVPDLVRALIEAAATLSRAEHRLTLADHVLGRRPTDTAGQPAGLSLYRARTSPAADAMAALAAAAASCAAEADSHPWPEAAALAADAASAYFVSDPDLSPTERLAALRAVADAASGCARTALRLGAASIAALEDDEGLAWLVRADALLRQGSTPLAALDHAAFLESELAHGSDDPMGVARAAAGICLVCAAAQPDQISFVRDDTLEEMAYAGWLVGRDQDRSLLIRVFLEIEHAQAPKKPARKATAKAATRKSAPKLASKTKAKPATKPTSKPTSKPAAKAAAKSAAGSAQKPSPRSAAA